MEKLHKYAIFVWTKNWRHIFSTMKKQGLGPLLCSHPDILILGSLPGDRSLELQEYYGHPQNRFWRVMSALSDRPLPQSYEDKKSMLSESGVILWDVYACASRPGSLDADIREAEFNDIASLLTDYPSIRMVATNGRTAEAAFRKYCQKYPAVQQLVNTTLRFCPLPSTSPANASWSLPRLIQEWRQIT